MAAASQSKAVKNPKVVVIDIDEVKSKFIRAATHVDYFAKNTKNAYIADYKPTCLWWSGLTKATKITIYVVAGVATLGLAWLVLTHKLVKR